MTKHEESDIKITIEPWEKESKSERVSEITINKTVKTITMATCHTFTTRSDLNSRRGSEGSMNGTLTCASACAHQTLGLV